MLRQCLIYTALLIFFTPIMAQAEEYIHQYNGDLEQATMPTTFWEVFDREGGSGYNGILRQSTDKVAGNYSMGFKFGGLGCPTQSWNDCSRVEMWAKQMQPISEGSYRWYAYSFKIDEIHDNDLFQSGRSIIINQYLYPSAQFTDNGPKIQFFLKQDDGDSNPNTLNMRMLVTQECNYSNSYDFVTPSGTYLCRNHLGQIRLITSIPRSVEVGEWYHVRVEIGADAPSENDVLADGRASAAIRKSGTSTWNVFRYGLQNYINIFSHEANENNGWSFIKHQLKYGIYSGGLRSDDQGYEASILFDEIYGEHYFSALPPLFRY